MKWLVLLLIVSASLLASCEDASWVVAVNNTDGEIFFRTSAAAGQVTMYSASLNGQNEVPPTDSQGTGLARFHVMKDGSIRWSLRVTNLNDIFAAHIHDGVPGENGPIVVHLFDGDPSAPVSGLNVRGVITDPTEAATVLELFTSGSAYVNVHTTAFQGGEIRGPVVPKETGGGGQQ
jgi:CHRD domain